MKRAIISDIHANIEALDAVLADINSLGISEIYCLGDLVGYGPDPLPCIDAARELDLCLLGNVDLATIFDAEDNLGPPEHSVVWTRRQMEVSDPPSNEVRWDFLCNLLRQHREDDFLYVHGSAHYPVNEYVFPDDIRDRRKMERIFALVPRYCFQGHTHIPGVFRESGQFLRPAELSDGFQLDQEKVMINVGSVGQSRDGDPRACYAVLGENRVTFRRVEFDAETTAKKMLLIN